MAFRLKKGVFKVTCKQPGCPFDFEVQVKQNIMGVTEEDVEDEAKKIARDIAMIKHDAIYGRKHSIMKPTIRKVSGVYESIGARTNTLISQSEAVKYKEFKNGDKVLKKGDIASTICEVIKGSAFPDKNKNHVYNIGDIFGAAALLVNQTRTADIIAGQDGTTIAFYNLKELSKKDPKKTRELYNNTMEDVFSVIADLGDLVDKLENELEREKIASENRKERLLVLEEEMMEAQKKITDFEGKDSFR